MSPPLESRQLTSWLWPDNSIDMSRLLLWTRILPSLRKEEGFFFRTRLIFPPAQLSRALKPSWRKRIQASHLPAWFEVLVPLYEGYNLKKGRTNRTRASPSAADQVRVRQDEAADIARVTRVHFKRFTLQLPGVCAQTVRSDIGSLRQKQDVPVQLQPRQQSEDKIHD